MLREIWRGRGTARRITTVLALGGLLLPAALAQGMAPVVQAAPSIVVQTVCFSVNNPGDPTPSTLYGRRYLTSRTTDSTPALVLAHGLESSTVDWDYTPSWSLARMLASRGYMVISYDRLGYDHSVYNRPSGGLAITTSGQRVMLHQVVGEVKTGAYSVAPSGACSGRQVANTFRNPTVVVIGHSMGGAVVSGYPGAYHDVAAMIQTDWANDSSNVAFPPLPTPPAAPVNSAHASSALQASLASSSDPVGPCQGHPEDNIGGVFDSCDPSYFWFFTTRAACQNFDDYQPGVVPQVQQIACDPTGFVPTPDGDLDGLGANSIENDAFITQTGSIPVLLTFGDHDGAFPPTEAQNEYTYWKTHCGCDVSLYMLKNTGHLFMAHKSLPSWINRVVTFLSVHGINGTR